MKTAPSPVRGGIKSFFKAPEWGLVAGLIVVLLLIYAMDSRKAFFTLNTQKFLMLQVARLGVLAIGAAVVIISGGIDLSVGAIVALSGVVVAKLITEWLPGAVASGSATGPSPGVVATAMILTILLGLAIGLLNSVLINAIRLPPFIATLATMAGLRSVASLVSKNKSINVSFSTFRQWGNDPYYTITLFVIVAICASIVMGRTILGRHLYALGGNEAAARLSGLPVRRLKTVAYGLSGMLAALCGIMFTGQSGQGTSTMGISYELYAITAAVVGGCSLAGGVGSIRGTVLGLILIQAVIRGTGLVAPPGIDSTQIEGLVLGTVVVLAVAFNLRFRARA